MSQWNRPWAEWNRNFVLLALAVCGVGAFFGVQFSLYNNFIVTHLDIEAHELGWVEALREVPGFLNVVFLALVVLWAPPLVAGLSLVVMGAGIAAYSQVDSVFSLALFSLVWSLGFHCWIPLEQSMALAFSPAGEKGRWLGQLRSLGSLATVLAIVMCSFLFEPIGYQGLFIVAGGLTALGGLALFGVREQGRPAKERQFVFKRRYALYYGLNFLQGCRKQIFITFAIFALVKVHGVPVETTIILILVNQILVTATAVPIGRLVDRFGERRMLSASYIGLVVVFSGYAVIKDLYALYVLYCIDNLIFFGGIALTTYLNKIAPAEELKPTLAMGVTMNHVASVVAPVAGGLAWVLFG